VKLPEVAGIITGAQIAQTVDAIASVQQPDGNIPGPGGHTDPWNLVGRDGPRRIRSRFERVRVAVRMQHSAAPTSHQGDG
jgi:hypothetical protein